ncbi:MAG TPA: flavodoxin domain-containing protein, partial [Syntrophorhabdaceae bacterium]|nr:flavodoxin domain-containing protein [Syntrophorhabdaceae bacterium]
FGTPIYMGRLKHRSFLKCNWDILSTKRLVVFGVSGLTSADPRQYKAFQASLPLHIRKKVTYYPLRGAFNYLKLDCIDKIFMSGPRIRFQINYWIKRNKEAREALSRFFSPHDWTDKSTTDPIVTFIERQLQQSMGAIDMSRNDQ